MTVTTHLTGVTGPCPAPPRSFDGVDRLGDGVAEAVAVAGPVAVCVGAAVAGAVVEADAVGAAEAVTAAEAAGSGVLSAR
ncbi:hypothetical protein, partial [Streptomyces sp. SID10815]|uniref:hypothetical protein n=1 Tax=Streptomyces sp. SID10815 TaxID=2706027 RepID=UPI0013DF2C41